MGPAQSAGGQAPGNGAMGRPQVFDRCRLVARHATGALLRSTVEHDGQVVHEPVQHMHADERSQTHPQRPSAAFAEILQGCALVLPGAESGEGEKWALQDSNL